MPGQASTPRPLRDDQIIRIRELIIDRNRMTAAFRSKVLDLSPTEFEILMYLAQAAGRVVSYEEIVTNHLKGVKVEREQARVMLSAHISNLRSKMRVAGCDNYLVNRRGRGYLIEADVESALRKSEAQIQLIVEHSQDIISAIDGEGIIQYVSPSIEHVLGYETEDAVGSSLDAWLPLAHPDDTDRLRQLFKSDLQMQSHVTLTFRFQHIEGHYIWLQAGVSILADETGDVSQLFFICRDITNIRQAQQALILSEERHRAISSVMSDFAYALTLVSPQERKLEWLTGAWERITGYSIDEAFHDSGWSTIVTAEDQQLLNDHMERLYAGQRDTSEWRITTKDQQIRWLRVYGDPVEHNDGIRVYGGAQDITDQKLTEAWLRESEERYRAVSSLASDYVYSFRLYDTGHHVLEWLTGAWEQISGYTVAEAFSGTGWTRIVHPDDTPIIKNRLNRLLALQADASEVRIITKSGAVRWVQLHGFPIQAEGYIRVYGAGRDITQQKQAEMTLRDSEQRLRQMMQQLPVVLWTTDVDLRVTFSSTQNSPVVPTSPLTKSIDHLLEALFASENSDDSFVIAHQRALRGETAIFTHTISSEVVVICIKPLHDDVGNVMGCTGIAVDHTMNTRLALTQKTRQNKPHDDQ